jgi:hypothetical protein
MNDAKNEKMWTMRVSDSNRLFLQTLCGKHETYDSAITKLVLNYENKGKVKVNKLKEIA